MNVGGQLRGSLYPIIPAGDRTTQAFVTAVDRRQLPTFLASDLPAPTVSCRVRPPRSARWPCDAQRQERGRQLLLPHAPTFGFRCSFSEPALFHEKQTWSNGDYIINQKNTLAMRFFYSPDPRTSPVQYAHRRSVAGSSGDWSNSPTPTRVLKLTTIVTNTLVNEAARVLPAPVLTIVRRRCRPDGRRRISASRPSSPARPRGRPFRFLINGFGAGGFLEPAFSPTNQYPMCRIRSPGRTEGTPSGPALRWKRQSGTSISRDWSAAGCSLEASPTCWPRKPWQHLPVPVLRIERPGQAGHHPRLSRDKPEFVRSGRLESQFEADAQPRECAGNTTEPSARSTAT